MNYHIPYIIDNNKNILAKILNDILAEHQDKSIDVATAYFTVGGFGLLKDNLASLANFRLLIGTEPTAGEEIGLISNPGTLLRKLRADIESEDFNEEKLRLVEDLISLFEKRKRCSSRL